MKKIIFISLSILIFLSCNFTKNKKNESISIKTYKDTLYISSIKNVYKDCYIAEKLKQKYQAANNCRIILTMFNNKETLLDSLKKNKCDLVLSFNYRDINYILEDSSFIEFKSDNFSKKLPQKNILIPYSYNFMGFAYNKNILPQPPKNFGEIQDGLLKNNFSFSHPLNSYFGQNVMAWTINNFDWGYIHFWRGMKKNIFVFSENFNESINALITKEAKITPAPISIENYLKSEHNIDFIKSFIPFEGTYKYYQCAFIPKKSQNVMHAKLFINELLTKQTQTKIFSYTYNFPIREDMKTKLISKTIELPSKDFENNIDYLKYNKYNKKFWEPLWKTKMKDLL